MANQESSAISSWLYERARAIFSEPGGMRRRPESRPRRRGLVVTICTLASLLLWFTFAMRETYTKVIEFPTEIRNQLPDEALSSLPPRTVRAQVQGEGIQLIRLYYDPPPIPISVASETVDLDVIVPETVKNVRLDNITPRTVTVYKEARVHKRIPVRPRVTVATPPGHHLIGPLRVQPDSILISGASSVVERLAWWPTVRERIASDDDTLEVTVALSDTLAGLVDRPAVSAVIRGSVREFTEGSRLVEVLVLDAPPGQRVSLEPSTVRITFQVPVRDYDRAMASDDFWAAVPYSAIRADTTGAVAPDPRLPAGIEFRQVRVDPSALRYFDVLD